MIKLSTLLFILSFSFIGFSTMNDNTEPQEIIVIKKDTFEYHFVQTHDLFTDNWHQLPQPLFWKQVMKLSPDSCVLNVARTRQILRVESLENWDKLSDDEKELARVKLREVYKLDSAERIFMTTGKSNFYQFELVYPSIKRAIKIFKENNTDPWYAQAILMIESPGKLEKSVAGAYGPFQLMRSVARKHGLRVDKYVDERKDFDKSAYGSAHLLRTSCVPEAKRIMRKFGVVVTPKMEKQLWFRLLVLHNYHAGAGNVENVLTNVVKPNCGCQSVITKIWQSSYGRFGNSSQNYSQLALASLLVLDEFMINECEKK